MQSLEEERQARKKKTQSLKTQLGAMSLSTGDGQVEAATIAVRNRFFYNFANKILNWAPNRTMIHGGNEVAHEGNIGLDLAIFQKRLPDDPNLLLIFKELYGLTYEQASRITGIEFKDYRLLLSLLATHKSKRSGVRPSDFNKVRSRVLKCYFTPRSRRKMAKARNLVEWTKVHNWKIDTNPDNGS